MTGVLFTLSMTGCGSTGTKTNTISETEAVTEESKSGKIELTVWAEQDNFTMMNTMIEAFKQKYAGEAEFEITLKAQSEASTKDIMLADIHQSGDIFSFPDDQLLGMIAAGAIDPVADNVEEIKSANVAEAVEAASYKGTLYAYPYTADNGYFLYYDKDYLSEEDVKTMDGILAVAEENEKTFSMEFNSGWYLYSFFGGTGLAFGLSEDGVTNYCEWNVADGAIKGTDIVEALLNITASPAFVAQADSGFMSDVYDGNCIAGISGVWNAKGIKEIWGDDYGACKLPTYTCAGQQIQMSSFTGYKMMGVSAYSEHPEWAHKLAAWLTNEENQTIRFVERNQGPSNINAAASEEVTKVPAIQAVIEQSQYGTLQRVGNHYWDPCTEFADIIAAGNPDGKPYQELIDELVFGITTSVSQ